MGDPRRLKPKYSGPRHPWNKARIEEEKKLKEEYGLKNKRELWKVNSKLKNFANQAKKLIAATGKQAELEKTQLINKLNSLGLIEKNAHMDDILSLTVRDLFDRRLQTIFCKKGYARSAKQARQFITHGHVRVNNKLIKAPSYLVKTAEEPLIKFLEKSSLSNSEHPERKIEKTTVAEAKEEEKEVKKARKKKKTVKKKARKQEDKK
jgi:small subunit ribosomal protein S4